MADGFNSWSDCINLCPRIQPGGRVPLTLSVSDAKHLSQIFYHPDSKDWFWGSFRYQTEGNFTDHFTGIAMSTNLWAGGQPNGGSKQKCTEWDGNNPEGTLYDMSCFNSGKKLQCLCDFDESPILRMRGISKGSKFDTHFTLRNSDISGGIIFMGLTGTVIRYESLTSEWVSNVNLIKTTASTLAEETSFILGRHKWRIEGDSAKCNEGQPFIPRELKFSGCDTDGEFTCDDGQCVTMEHRCDQVPDCQDESDERRCKMLVTREGYNKEVPPFNVNSYDRSIVPVQLYISIDLLKIVDMEETDHKISFQFAILLEWRESDRVVYHNLKHDTSLNALTNNDFSQLWLPLVIYDNTDQKEMTRLGSTWEWNTQVNVIRDGNFTRSGLEVVDEAEIFKGNGNTIRMEQVYTWQFQCNYNIKDYPFDTQVRNILLYLKYFLLSRCALLRWQWEAET